MSYLSIYDLRLNTEYGKMFKHSHTVCFSFKFSAASGYYQVKCNEINIAFKKWDSCTKSHGFADLWHWSFLRVFDKNSELVGHTTVPSLICESIRKLLCAQFIFTIPCVVSCGNGHTFMVPFLHVYVWLIIDEPEILALVYYYFPKCIFYVSVTKILLKMTHSLYNICRYICTSHITVTATVH
jgi:hypothetical protein